MGQRRRAGDWQGRLAEATAPARTACGRLGEPSLPVLTDALLPAIECLGSLSSYGLDVDQRRDGVQRILPR